MSPYNNAIESKQKYRYGFNPYIKSQYNYLQNKRITKIKTVQSCKWVRVWTFTTHETDIDIMHKLKMRSLPSEDAH